MKFKTLSKLIATTALAAVISTTGFVEKAEAAPRSYYYMVERLNGDIQHRFAMQMIRTYERAVERFEPLVQKYGDKPWAKFIVDYYDFYKAELVKYQTLVGITAETPKPTVTHTTVKTNQFTQTRETPEKEVSRTEKIVQETVNQTTVNEYLVVNVVYEKTVTTREIQGIFTTYHYSDKSTRTEVSSKILSTGTEKVQRQEELREFIRSYEIEIADPETDTGTPTENVLTVEEYLARDDVSLGGTETYKQAAWKMNANINENYITRESGLYKYGTNLEVIGAPDAWARGWTGKGSNIAILDTGIDLDHTEFAGRITATECFTGMCNAGYETVDDGNRYSHGTHVAGIAAAALDGEGTTGVAPDANLLIGKVAWDNGFYQMGKLGEAITWAVNNDADAINVSGNVNVDWTYRKSIVELGDGFYQSTDTRSTYATAGYNNMMKDYTLPQIASAMADAESVIVFSAGNQGLDVPTFPAHYAIAEDANGELLLGGRALIVGNWDIRGDRLHRSSNRAGTMCFETNADGSCANDRKISDYYLVAPGMYIAAPDKDGEYRLNSGTSMAAPAVTGAVGVIHQMWPYMTGENIARLLLDTADDTITGYDVNIHGQGMLDLAEATSPQGAVGIPTTGRIDGSRNSFTSSGVAMQGGGQIAALESLQVVDDYDRNFGVDGNDLIGLIDTRTADPVQAAEYNVAPDYYFGYAGGKVINTEAAAFNISNTGSASVAFTHENMVFGLVEEDTTFLGNYAQSPLMTVNGSTTAYIGYNVDYAMNDQVSVFGNASMGVTTLDVDSTSLMKRADTLVSNSATVGVRNDYGSGENGLVASLPVAIVDGSATFETPSAVSATGDVEYLQSDSSLAANNREFSIGAFQKINITDKTQLSFNVEARMNYAGTDETVTTAGVGFNWRF